MKVTTNNFLDNKNETNISTKKIPTKTECTNHHSVHVYTDRLFKVMEHILHIPMFKPLHKMSYKRSAF